MIKNIEVKEKNLINKLNDNVARWDNNGPVQFEEENKTDPETYKVGENFPDNRDKYYDKDVKVREKTVTLQPRNPDGTFAKVLDVDYNAEDVAESRETVNKEIKGTRPRTPSNEPYEYVNHPPHYNNYDVEVIEMMEKVFGLQAVIDFCKLNAFKYRMRAGTKPNISAQQDLDKEKWYLDKMNELKNR